MPARPARRWPQAAAPGDEQAGDGSAHSPPGPAPQAADGVAEGRFSRTRAAVEIERFEAEGVHAWSHVLRTPEEIGATQEGRLGRLLRRPFRFGSAGPTATGPPARNAPGDAVLRRPGAVSRRGPSRAAAGGAWNVVAFVLALCTGALTAILLFGGLLGLPDEALRSQWTSWSLGKEDRQAAPPERGETAVAGFPDGAGQGGPELALRSKVERPSDATDVAARVARSEPSVSDLVAAGTAAGTWQRYYRLGHRLHAEGDLRGAVEMYRQAAALKPDDAAMLYDWARALEMLGDRDAAIQKYRAVMAVAPDGPAGADARARLSELQGQ